MLDFEYLVIFTRNTITVYVEHQHTYVTVNVYVCMYACHLLTIIINY